MCQEAALHLEPGVNISKLPTKLDHRTHLFTEELEADYTAPARKR